MFDPFKIDGDDELDFDSKNFAPALPPDLLNECGDDDFMFDDTDVCLSESQTAGE